MSRIKAKRHALIETYRADGEDSRRKLISNTIQDVYDETDMGKDEYDAFLEMHNDLMVEIEETIRLELELQEGEEYFSVEDYDYDDSLESQNAVICPLCRNRLMTVESSESRIAVCECGANISLVHKISGQCFGLDTLSELLASVIDRHYEVCVMARGEKAVSADHDHNHSSNDHHPVCAPNIHWSLNSVFDMEGTTDATPSFFIPATLDFQICGTPSDELHAWCAQCGFHEKVL